MSLAFRVFSPFALGYLLASIFRSINAVIAPDLVRDLGLSASELGFAVSAFFLSATLFQIPYGILLDRYDPRRLYAGFLLLCALGAAMVAFSDGIILLSLGRAFIALGTTASAVTSFKVFSMWYPPERLPTVNGLALASGGLGLMVGTAPVEAALNYFDWRDVHLIIGVFVVAGAGVVFFVAPSKKTVRTGVTLFQQIKGLGDVFKSMVFWRVAPLLAIVIGVFGGFPALWAGPWVRDIGGFSDLETANLLLLLAGAMTLSSAVTGPVTGLARRLGLAPLGVAVTAAILFTLVMAVLYLQWTPSHLAVFATWMMFGFVAPFMMVIYAVLAAQFPLQMTGRLNACLTLSWFLGAFLIQNIYGFALDRFPNADGKYALEGHRLGMGLMIVLLVAALVWYFIATLMMKKQDEGELS